MGFVIDIILVLIMVACIFIGYKKGLMKVAINLIAIILSIIIALILYKPFATLISNNTQIDEKITDSIYEKIKDVDFENISKEEKEKNEILKLTDQYVEDAMKNSKDNMAKYIAQSLSNTILDGIAFILLLIIIRIALIALNFLADIIGNLPVIKQFNKSGGIIYGIVEGFFIVNVILAICYVLNPLCLDGKIEDTIEESNLCKMVYENNIIVNIIL